MAHWELWDAISKNNLKEIQRILSTEDIELNKPKKTFLHEACVSGSPVVACALVKAGANVNACSVYEEVIDDDYYECSVTALILAVIQRKVDLVEKLIHRCGADVNVTNDEGLAPLHFIAEMIFSARVPLEKYGRYHDHGENSEEIKKITSLLLTAGATVDLQDKNGETPLHFASMESEKGSVTVDIFLKHGARADIQDGNGMTPLHNAVKAQNVVTVQLLLQHGATVDIQNDVGLTPLHFIADVATAKILLEHGAKANIPNNWGMTPLCYAAKANNVATARILLQHHARADILSEGSTPLHMAFHTYGYHAIELCKLLIQELGTNSSTVLNRAEKDGTTLLHAVIKALVPPDHSVQPTYDGDLADTLVKLLIEKGADLEAKKDHLTPLHLAAEGGLLNIVKILVEAGADIHAETLNTGLTPLDMAEHGRSQDIIDYLTALG